MTLQLRRGNDAERQTVTFAEGELVYTTDTKTLYVGDGTTEGGIRVTGDMDGSLPELNEDLDLNSYSIIGVGEISISGDIIADNFTGNIIDTAQNKLVDVDTGTFNGTFEGTFIGDGSGLTNLPELSEFSVFDLIDVTTAFDSGTQQDIPPAIGDTLIFNGTNFISRKIETITGINDITIVDATTNTFTGKFVGDGSELTGIVATGGVVEGETYRINIAGEDSSILLDSVNNELNVIFVGTEEISSQNYKLLDNLNDVKLELLYDNDPQDGEINEIISYNCKLSITSVGEGIFLFSQGSTIQTLSLLEAKEGVKGNILSETNDVLVDSVNGTIPGYISIQELKNALNSGTGTYEDFKSYILGL